MTKRFLIAVVFVLGLGVTPAAAQGNASQFIQKLADQAIAVLNQQSLPLAQREQRFRQLLREGFDLPFIARFVLGRYWRRATPEAQQDYLSVFGEYVLLSYSNRLGGYSGETFSVLGEREAGKKDVIVTTQIDRPSGPAIRADWRVRVSGPEPRVIDVMVEGVSMAVTQRQEFASVVQRNGLDGLIQVLQARISRLSATARQS